MWPKIRAGLVAAAIGFGLIDGLPVPTKPEPWQQRMVDTVRPIQRLALLPVAWLARALVVSERWPLFTASGGDRFRMTIEGRDGDGTWRTLYRAGDPDHDDDIDVLHYRRVRDAWDPGDTAASNYAGFCTWMVARVLARHAELTAARVYMEKIVIDGGEVTATGERVLGCGGAR